MCGVLLNEEYIALIIHIDIVSAIGQTVGDGSKLGIVTPKFLIVLDPQSIFSVGIYVIGSLIPLQRYGSEVVFGDTLAIASVPKVNAVWSSCDDSAIVQL